MTEATTGAMTGIPATRPVDGPPSRRAVLAGHALIGFCALLSLAVGWVVLFPPAPYDVHRPDFGVFWVVSDMVWNGSRQIYDPIAVTDAQAFIADPTLGLFPWVYPPTALGLVSPFSALPFWTAYAVWLVISVVAYAAAVKALAGRIWPVALALTFASFPLWTAVRAGQLAPFIAALAIAGILALDRRPLLAGLLIAVVGLVKPQLMILAPIALAAGGHWRAFVAAAGTTLAGVATTLMVFGVWIWQDWFTAVSGFPDILVDLGIETHAVTWRSFLTEIGIEGVPRTILHGAGAVAAAVVVALVFARRCDPGARLTALVGCGFFITPYAMKYDLLILLPVAAWLLARPKQSGFDWCLAICGFGLFYPIPPFAGAVVVVFVPSVAYAALTGRLGALPAGPIVVGYGSCRRGVS